MLLNRCRYVFRNVLPVLHSCPSRFSCGSPLAIRCRDIVVDIPDVVVHIDALLCEVVLDNAGGACAPSHLPSFTQSRAVQMISVFNACGPAAHTPQPFTNAFRHGDTTQGPVSLVVITDLGKERPVQLTFSLTTGGPPTGGLE